MPFPHQNLYFDSAMTQEPLECSITELGIMLEDLVGLTQCLLVRFNESEPHFLKIADLLEKIAEEISINQENCKKFVEAESGQLNNENIVMRGVHLVRETVEGTEKITKRMEASIHKLKSMQNLAETLLKNESRLQAAIAPFTIVRVLFKIHSAPLAAEHRMIFASLAEELAKLDQSVREVFLDQFRNLHQVKATLDQLLPGLDQKNTLAQHRLRNHQKEMAETLDLLEIKVTESKNQTKTLDQLSAELQPQFTLLIMGTQFHDIVRQRLEHICLAVAEMKKEFNLHTSNPSKSEREDFVHFLAGSLLIQQKQMESLTNQVTEAEETIRSGLQGLVVCCEKLFREAVKLKDTEDKKSSIRSVIQSLFLLFNSLPKELENGRDTSLGALNAVTPLKGMVSDLTGVLSRISMDIRLIALNSQVKAAHINEGTGLDILSTKTCEISSEILELNTQLSGDLMNLLEVFSDSFSTLKGNSEETESHSNFFLTEAKNTSLSLQSLQTKTSSAFKVIEKANQEVETTSEQILNELKFREKLLSDTEKFAALMDRLQPWISEVTGRKLLPLKAKEQIDNLRKFYTMAEEHAIHNQLFPSETYKGNSGDSPPPSAVAATTEIEFF